MCHNHKLQIETRVHCSLVIHNDVYIKMIKHSILCLTGVHLGDITNALFFTSFALECESSERLLF